MKTLIFDTETTGLPLSYKAPLFDSDNWPRLIELAFVLTDDTKDNDIRYSAIIKPDGFIIPANATAINGITTDKAIKEGLPLHTVLDTFYNAVNDADIIVGHNVSFDRKIIGAEYYRAGIFDNLHGKARICTKFASTKFCNLKGKRGLKWPKLKELHFILFGCDFDGEHRAMADVDATIKCYNELVRVGVIDPTSMC